VELVLLISVVILQLVVLGLLLRGPPPSEPSSADVSAKDRSGPLPGGGTWEIVAGMTGEPVLHSGVVVLEVKSDRVWVHEVWARTDHGWVQLQPGPGEGAFRNALVSGLRISSFRLWLAPAGQEPDETDLRAAAALLVPAALFLARANRSTPIPASRAPTPPPNA
jgi:hypothetical protein